MKPHLPQRRRSRRIAAIALTGLLVALPAAAASAGPAAGIRDRSAALDPLTCPFVTLGIAGFRPAAKGKGPYAPGVRARIRVSEPSLLTLVPTLRWGSPTSRQSVQLMPRTLGDTGLRNLRVPLPGATGGVDVGVRVTLALAVTATPDSSPGCVDPARQSLTFHTRVVVVRDVPQSRVAESSP